MARPEPNICSQKCGNGWDGALASTVMVCATCAGTRCTTRNSVASAAKLTSRATCRGWTRRIGKRIATLLSMAGEKMQRRKLSRPCEEVNLENEFGLELNHAASQPAR